jgi:hypothetical protein
MNSGSFFSQSAEENTSRGSWSVSVLALTAKAEAARKNGRKMKRQKNWVKKEAGK